MGVKISTLLSTTFIMEKTVQQTKQALITGGIFLFPLFFLPVTQEFYQTNKFFFLALFSLLFLFVATILLLLKKKIELRQSPVNIALLLFVISQALSVIISSPNKVQAILSVPAGFAVIAALAAVYFIVANNSEKDHEVRLFDALYLAAAICSLIALIFFFNPFKNAPLPSWLSFLKSLVFNPLGTSLDTVVFLSFFPFFGIIKFVNYLKDKSASTKIISHGQNLTQDKKAITLLAVLIISLVGTATVLMTMIKPAIVGGGKLDLPPINVSWFASVETLKKPTSALFGVGLDNFTSQFTRVKPVEYNQTPLWQLNFNRAGSAVLQFWTESGLLGLIAFVLLAALLIKELVSLRSKGDETFPYLAAALIYTLAALFLLPVSLPLLFLFFVTAGEIVHHSPNTKKLGVDLSAMMPVYVGVAIVSWLIIIGAGYFLTCAYAAEVYFKQAADALASNDGTVVYNKIAKAIQTNPYNEGYHITFSQINLLIANNIASRVQSQPTDKKKLSDQDRQIITQAVQQAILEAKFAVQLNPEKSQNWENLGIIYRNIINVAQGADAWTVAAYQRAITSDPVNPSLRLNLGGVYYSLQNYGVAAQLFQQAVALKQDWANAQYNLAWALYQNGNYQEAVLAMQNVLGLINKDNPDYTKAKTDFDTFKEKLPKKNQETQQATGEAQLTPTQQQELSLPQAPQTVITPKIQLPREASPETALQPTGEPQPQ